MLTILSIVLLIAGSIGLGSAIHQEQTFPTIYDSPQDKPVSK